MSIEAPDFELIVRTRRSDCSGNVCAILGDCRYYHPPSADQFMQEAKFNTVHTFDINGSPTHVVDLNNKIPEEYHNKYDWVIDSGTLYCCFDVATVFENMMKMVKVGGYCLHTGNLSGFYGRGFYSLSPALFSEIYPINGFEVKFLGSRTKRNRGRWQTFPPGLTYLKEATENHMIFTKESCGFVPMIPNDSMICCLAKKIEDREFTKPVPEHFIKTRGK